MTQNSYRRALDEAIKEYEKLGAQRSQIDERLAHLTQMIGTLSKLCNLVPTVSLGLTDACRMALKTAGHPLTAGEVRMQLEATGMDLSRYSNPLASIHTVLKRLRQSGEARFVPRAHAKPMYSWKRPVKIVALSKSTARRKLARLFATEVPPVSDGE